MSKNNLHRYIEIYGWLGVLCILAAYAAINFSFLTPQDFSYHALNIFGSIGVGLDAYLKRNLAPVALQLAWITIALFSLARIFS
jgi:hypothetical protein